MPKVNPDVLRWARETAGLTEEAAARRIGLCPARGLSPQQRVAALEAGEAEPIDAQLDRIAAAYRRPLLTFYLDRPPVADQGVEDFRTLPERRPAAEGLVAALLRDIRARQATVRELMQDDEANRWLSSARFGCLTAPPRLPGASPTCWTSALPPIADADRRQGRSTTCADWSRLPVSSCCW